MNWKKNLIHSEFDPTPRVAIPRKPPHSKEDGDVAVRYHDTVTELEQIYTGMVREAGKNPDALEEALDTFDPRIDELMGTLADIFKKTVTGKDGVAGLIQEHENMLRGAAILEQGRVIKALEAKEQLQRDIEQGM